MFHPPLTTSHILLVFFFIDTNQMHSFQQLFTLLLRYPFVFFSLSLFPYMLSQESVLLRFAHDRPLRAMKSFSFTCSRSYWASATKFFAPSRFRARKSSPHSDRYSRIWTQLRLTNSGIISIVTRNVSTSRSPTVLTQVSHVHNTHLLLDTIVMPPHESLAPRKTPFLIFTQHLLSRSRLSSSTRQVLGRFYPHSCELLFSCSFTNAVSHVVVRRRLSHISHARVHSLLSRILSCELCLYMSPYPLASASLRTRPESYLLFLFTMGRC